MVFFPYHLKELFRSNVTTFYAAIYLYAHMYTDI